MASIGKQPAPTAPIIHRKEWPRIREITARGQRFFQVDPRPSSKREAFASLSDARVRADQLANDRAEFGKQGFYSPIKDRVLMAELQAKTHRYGKTLAEAVDTAIRVWEEDTLRSTSVPMSEALDKWLETKEQRYRAGKLRRRTIESLRPMAGEFRSSMGHLRVMDITAETILAFENARPLAARTILHKRAALSEFFRFCMLKQWRIDNPVERLHSLARIETNRIDVSILSVQEAKHLLECAVSSPHRSHMAPYAAICLFAGLRPTEAQRLDWKHVHLETGQIEVLAKTSKINESRFVPIETNLAAWMKEYRKASGRVVGNTNFRRKWDAVRVAAGYAIGTDSEGKPIKGTDWPDDGPRHSYASYWLAVHQERAKLAEQMGNSLQIIKAHYRRAISPEVAKAFWSIKP